MSRFTETEAGRKELQTALIKAGYPVGIDGADGRLGTDSAAALKKFRKEHGMSDAAVIDSKLLRALNLEEHMSTELSKPSWITGLTGNTLFNYLLTFVGGILAAKFGLDADVFSANLPDLMDKIIALFAAIAAVIGAFRGLKASATPKVSVEGQVVKLSEMPPEDQKTVAAIAAKNA